MSLISLNTGREQSTLTIFQVSRETETCALPKDTLQTYGHRLEIIPQDMLDTDVQQPANPSIESIVGILPSVLHHSLSLDPFGCNVAAQKLPIQKVINVYHTLKPEHSGESRHHLTLHVPAAAMPLKHQQKYVQDFLNSFCVRILLFIMHP